ncbi:uncharacterized protein LOC122650107 isoform X3 [Telopea speciosissima]|uniref:uncharacterized protein LOC122650107 isoform X3 n=1 Tax=Telopea speciosissima TaxID=54955 RepID=UPI001CC813CE|nr:uncharacterized protein LOC122650107 isoform X3 [Telopea speciosissima]
MAVLINCCLNISPPPPPLLLSSSSSSSSSSAPLRINRIPRQRQGKEESGSWRNQVIVGVACMIIGFEMGPLVVNNYDYNCAIAATEELKFINNGKGDQKWSEKRMCPPWRMNSLETIVPENLPRASAHRKFEDITLSSTAPSTSSLVTVKAVRSNCFSL